VDNPFDIGEVDEVTERKQPHRSDSENLRLLFRRGKKKHHNWTLSTLKFRGKFKNRREKSDISAKI
jgi:hypothetical protein